jgi:hypothetical protein
MSTPAIDYDALARQYGATSAPSATVDYDALAKKHGAISSTAQPDYGAYRGIGAEEGSGDLYSSPQPDHSVYSQNMAARSVPRPALPSELQPAGAIGRTAYQVSEASREGLRDVGRVGLGVLSAAGSAFSNPTSANYAMAEPTAQSVAANPDMPARAAIGSALGVDVSGLKQAAQQGNVPMLLEKSASPLLAALTGIAAGRRMGGGRPVGDALLEGPQAAVVPEAANLPPAAVSGTERIFRAAAPVGSDPQFRSNLYASAGDLAEIGQKLNLREASGGVINPDLRVRATVDAINDHLGGMYQGERAPQIARNAQNPVVANFGPDATEGLQYLSRNAGEVADRRLAINALQSETVPLADIDGLARAANRELLPLGGMTPQELAVSEGNSRRFASLQALDQELSGKIGGELGRL